jgi:hypothetical protein
MDRKEMALLLEEHLRNVNVQFDRENEFPKGGGPLKTYILEAHAQNGETIGQSGAAEVLFDAAERFGLKVRETDDRTLFEASKGDVGFFFDILDSRFWVAHTMSNIDAAEPLLKSMVDENPNLDYAWPPSDLMRSLQKTGRPLGFAVDFDETEFLSAPEAEVEESNAVFRFRHGGTGADRWLRQLESFDPSVLAFSMVKFSREDRKTESHIVQELNEHGRLKAAGNSITLHLQVVSLVLHKYKSLIVAIENAARIRPSLEPNGKLLLGEPIVFSFPKPLADFETFVRELVSCKEPLRIWGLQEETGGDHVHVEAVDMHTGSRLRFDVTPDFMRIYLGPHACGNTVARLLRNLQAHVDATIRINLPPDDILLEAASS